MTTALCPECDQVRPTHVVYGRLQYQVHNDGKRGRWTSQCPGSHWLVEDWEIVTGNQAHLP